MNAEVVVHGEVDPDNLWPYVKGAQRDGARAVLRLHVHDSQELVAVLRMMTVRGLSVTHAKLLPP